MKVEINSIQTLLDTGAKVDVMYVRTLRELKLTNCLRPDPCLVYGVGGTPISVVGSVDIPISVPGADTCWVNVHILEARNRLCY